MKTRKHYEVHLYVIDWQGKEYDFSEDRGFIGYDYYDTLKEAQEKAKKELENIKKGAYRRKDINIRIYEVIEYLDDNDDYIKDSDYTIIKELKV